jgi:3-methyl-2-oxobutanoate hydroxymethyltransferase
LAQVLRLNREYLRYMGLKTARQITKQKGRQKLTVLTCYDALTAQIFNENNELDMLLVGDSLGNVVCGESSTVPVTLDQIIYHAKLVRRGAPNLFLVGDLPFMTYPFPEAQSLENIKRLIQETRVEAVKLEGASQPILNVIEKSVLMGCAVMGHIGVTPQQVNKVGYRRQGKNNLEKTKLLNEAKDLEQAGVFALVLECVESDIAGEITRTLNVPTIGIGSGNYCDGQVWVTPDLLGLVTEPPPFMKPLGNLRSQIQETTQEYIKRVHADNLYSEEQR